MVNGLLNITEELKPRESVEANATCMNSEHGGHPTCPHIEQVISDLREEITRLKTHIESLAPETEERETRAAYEQLKRERDEALVREAYICGLLDEERESGVVAARRQKEAQAEIAQLRLALKRATDDFVKPTVDALLTRLAQAKQEQDVLLAVVWAVHYCEGGRGVFSCCPPHDCRCPKSRADAPEKWKGKWVCVCGREKLDRALAHPLVQARLKEARDGM